MRKYKEIDIKLNILELILKYIECPACNDYTKILNYYNTLINGLYDIIVNKK